MSLFRASSKQREVVGVQFSADGIAFAHVFPNGPVPQVRHCEFIPLSDQASPEEALQARVDRLGLRGRTCNLVLGREDYTLLLVEAPAVPANELRQALSWKVRDLIDFPVAEAVVDAFLLPEDKSRGSKRMAYVAVARRATITRLVNQANESDLKLASIDIPELALRNLVVNCCETDRGAALVKLVPGGGSLQIVRGDDLFLARQFALPYEGGLLEDLPADALVLELQRSLDYFERQMRQPPPAQVYLAGENVSADKLTDEIQSALPADLTLLSLAPGLDIDAQIPAHSLSLCLDALGAGLRTEKREEG
ncbi:MSHA biogenesis protein MshI [Marinimicrobium sp. ABcell2]|uniref:MSHA biogenesis protein MshI n=1 Tax=Marinimicrobium sp. ABcell2 TaxID=3069751 RepID=UPI0027B7F1AA|nr:MSHA biogenesis protein MshI [Marinimicrobium sp. ABcell2]MDQ2075218.1 MSHA biogenesis protein MshI [Marinimicrobium sp. ABcell2]